MLDFLLTMDLLMEKRGEGGRGVVNYSLAVHRLLVSCPPTQGWCFFWFQTSSGRLAVAVAVGLEGLSGERVPETRTFAAKFLVRYAHILRREAAHFWLPAGWVGRGMGQKRRLIGSVKVRLIIIFVLNNSCLKYFTL